jgi:hypothetical protein
MADKSEAGERETETWLTTEGTEGTEKKEMILAGERKTKTWLTTEGTEGLEKKEMILAMSSVPSVPSVVRYSRS